MERGFDSGPNSCAHVVSFEELLVKFVAGNNLEVVAGVSKVRLAKSAFEWVFWQPGDVGTSICSRLG